MRALPGPGRPPGWVRPTHHPPATGGRRPKARPWGDSVPVRRDIRLAWGGWVPGRRALLLFFSAGAWVPALPPPLFFDIRSHALAGPRRPATDPPTHATTLPGADMRLDGAWHAGRGEKMAAPPGTGWRRGRHRRRGRCGDAQTTTPAPAWPLSPTHTTPSPCARTHSHHTHRPHEAVLGVERDEGIVFALARAVWGEAGERGGAREGQYSPRLVVRRQMRRARRGGGWCARAWARTVGSWPHCAARPGLVRPSGLPAVRVGAGTGVGRAPFCGAPPLCSLPHAAGPTPPPPLPPQNSLRVPGAVHV